MTELLWRVAVREMRGELGFSRRGCVARARAASRGGHGSVGRGSKEEEDAMGLAAVVGGDDRTYPRARSAWRQFRFTMGGSSSRLGRQLGRGRGCRRMGTERMGTVWAVASTREEPSAGWLPAFSGSASIREWDEAVVRHEGFLRNWARRLATDLGLKRHDVEDAEQEALLAVLRGAHRYERVSQAVPDLSAGALPRCGESTFRTFAATIVRNRVLNHARGIWRRSRRAGRRPESLGTAERRGFFATPPLSPALPGQGGATPVPPDRGDGADTLEAVVDERLQPVVLSLRARERRLLSAWLRSNSDAEAASLLGLTPTAAKLRRLRLFAKLRRRFFEKE